MLFTGKWNLDPDGVLRPVIRGAVLAEDGTWVEVPFLVDTGADRTVFSGDILEDLHLAPLAGPDRVEGLGGIASSVIIETQVRFPRETGEMIVFQGRFAAVTDPAALDMSVLGRDITNLFAVLVDRPGDVVCLLGQRHRYQIEQT